MNHLNISMALAILFFFSACKQEPKTEEVSFKRTDNSVVALLQSDVGNLIPILYRTTPEAQVVSQVYNYLTYYDYKSETYLPELIKEVPTLVTLDDGDPKGKYLYTFEFLEEAVWEDGSPITGNDYAFTMKLVYNPLIRNAGRFYPYFSGFLKSIEVDADNPKIMRVYLDKVYFNSLENLTNTLPLMPAYLLDPNGYMDQVSFDDLIEINKQVDEDEEKALAAIEDGPIGELAAQFVDPNFIKNIENIKGSGPYELTEWVAGQRVTLKRKSDWWGDKLDAETFSHMKAYPDEIIYKPLTEGVTVLASIKSEEIDATYRINSKDFNGLKEDATVSQTYDLHSQPSYVCFFLSINMDNPILADVAVRRALSKIVNVEQILKDIYLGYGIRIASPVHPSQSYYNKDLTPPEQNLEEARKILTEAGWEDSNNNGILDKTIEGELKELSLEYLISTTESARNAALLVQSSAKEVGMELNINPQEGAVYFGNWARKNYDIVSAGSSISALWNPAQSWHTQMGQNRTGFGNAETDALIEKILITLDEPARNQLYKEFQAKIDEEIPYIFLFSPTTPIAVHKRFEYEPSVFYPCYDPKLFKLKEEYK